MHELSIAQNIVEIVKQYVPESDRKRVVTVRLKIGEAAGVVPESLEFSFQAITAESALSNARIEIEHVPFCIQCNACGAQSENEAGLAVCGECGSTDTKVVSGSELSVTEIEITEPIKEKS